MDAKTHWEKGYTTKEPEAVSWYRPHLETSLALIERAAPSHSASIIDMGAGESTLVDDLLARGYENVTVLDVSQTALEVTKKRLGVLAEQIDWIVADITQVLLEPFAYDVGTIVQYFIFSLQSSSVRLMSETSRRRSIPVGT
jgi:2-polyprenyl-3-methyl-5-hydroxy-6-metoxy-1,4-benzoquinol methylase